MTEVPNSSQDNVCGDEKMEVGKTTNSDVSTSGGKNDPPKHPYHLQLAEFEPNAWQLEECEPVKYLSLEETKLTFVDSQGLLDEMMTKLKEVNIFAIDLEHHSYRSYIGMVCLVQISTRTEDFIVDAITLKEELKVLNEVCTDPNILKVLHSSHADILGLQRDLGVYIINMFDTFEAARNLKGNISLAHILKEICNVDMDKKYQLADWKSRPLPSEMINYAREDVRYLLYVYDIYRNKLLKGSDSTNKLLKAVYKKSTELCGVVYVEKVFKPFSYKAVYKKVKKGILTPQQLECFRLLYAWRDKIAREQDESTGYTLPNNKMFQIAKQLPTTQEGITACINPLPPLVDQNITHILSLVTEATKYIPDLMEGANDAVKIGSQKVDKSAMEQGKLSSKKKKNLNKKPYCFKCRKPGHLAKDCLRYDPYPIRDEYAGPLNMVRNHPYGRPPPPRGGYGRGVFVGGYGRGGYEPMSQAYPMGYGAVRPSSNYYMNPWHPYS